MIVRGEEVIQIVCCHERFFSLMRYCEKRLMGIFAKTGGCWVDHAATVDGRTRWKYGDYLDEVASVFYRAFIEASGQGDDALINRLYKMLKFKGRQFPNARVIVMAAKQTADTLD